MTSLNSLTDLCTSFNMFIKCSKLLGARYAAKNKMDKNKQIEQLSFHGIFTPPGDTDNEHNE